MMIIKKILDRIEIWYNNGFIKFFIVILILIIFHVLFYFWLTNSQN